MFAIYHWLMFESLDHGVLYIDSIWIIFIVMSLILLIRFFSLITQLLE